MNQKFLAIVLTIFLIGNFHVVTDWCNDVSTNSASLVSLQTSDQTSEQASEQTHNADSDLCGHCGHLGLNFMQIAATEFEIFLNIEESSPIETIFNFDSNFTSPPTPPPLQVS